MRDSPTPVPARPPVPVPSESSPDQWSLRVQFYFAQTSDCAVQTALAERRVIPRCEVTVVCPVRLAGHSRECRAVLVDIHTAGARLVTPWRGRVPPLDAGESISIQMCTPFGVVDCESRVMWSRPEGSLASVGLAFDSLIRGAGSTMLEQLIANASRPAAW